MKASNNGPSKSFLMRNLCYLGLIVCVLLIIAMCSTTAGRVNAPRDFLRQSLNEISEVRNVC